MNSAISEPVRLIWSRIIWRQWRRAPKVPSVLVVILALGVAVYLSVRLANRAAVTGFSLFTESISGDSDLLLRPKAGTFREADLPQLRDAMGAVPASMFPILDTTAAEGPGSESPIFRIIGTDFVALPNAAYLSESDAGSPVETTQKGFAGLLGRSDLVYISESYAAEKQIGEGDSIRIYIEGAALQLSVAGVLKNDPLRPQIPHRLLVLDLPGAQKLTGNEGLISRVEIRIPPGPDYQKNLDLAMARLNDWGSERFVIETPGQRKDSATQMSAAFRLNLTILSTLALIVGAYLILQAMEASVIQRRSEIAILRCLGVTPRQIQKAWLVESAILGLLGSLLGVILGLGLAQGMVRAIASTVNTLYYETTTSSASFHLGEIGVAFVFGTLVSLLAGWLPAREAASTPPAHAANSGARGGGLKLLQKPLPGILLMVIATGFAFLPPWIPEGGGPVALGGYHSAFCFLLGLSILAGSLFRVVAKFLKGRGNDPQRNYAASQFRLPEGRHRLAAAGLLAAFGMSAAMGILVASFETTLNAWIRQMLKADIYIAAPGAQSSISENKIPESVWKTLVDRPGIEGVDRLRRYQISLAGKDTYLAGADYNQSGRTLQLIWVDPPVNRSADALEAMVGNDLHPAWISEGFARQYQKRRGDRFKLPTPEGAKKVEVSGIYADYGSERGTVLVSRKYTSVWFDDSSLNNIAIYLESGVDEEAWLANLQKSFPGVVARTNRHLRDDALRLFRQTFSVTYALEGIAVVIAVAGLGLAMVGLLLERMVELGTLKELGMTRRQIAKAAMWEGLGLSITGIVGGLILSLILGWILVYVVNRQSFGWTLNYEIPWVSIAALSAAMLATGGFVAWLVGYRIANLRSDLVDRSTFEADR
ncbi:MAG: FtsX-like permease family protein [Verrucomicrobiales bacterium]|nr:FtsX-like permease family protein [Verrucomicrobiales bacterium]